MSGLSLASSASLGSEGLRASSLLALLLAPSSSSALSPGVGDDAFLSSSFADGAGSDALNSAMYLSLSDSGSSFQARSSSSASASTSMSAWVLSSSASAAASARRVLANSSRAPLEMSASLGSWALSSAAPSLASSGSDVLRWPRLVRRVLSLDLRELASPSAGKEALVILAGG